MRAIWNQVGSAARDNEEESDVPVRGLNEQLRHGHRRHRPRNSQPFNQSAIRRNERQGVSTDSHENNNARNRVDQNLPRQTFQYHNRQSRSARPRDYSASSREENQFTHKTSDFTNPSKQNIPRQNSQSRNRQRYEHETNGNNSRGRRGNHNHRSRPADKEFGNGMANQHHQNTKSKDRGVRRNEKNDTAPLPSEQKDIDNHPQLKEIKPMGFERLKDLVNKSASEIVLTICNSRSGFSLRLNSSMGRDMTAYVWLALGKSVSAHLSKNVNNMVNMVTKNETFMESILTYLASFQRYDSKGYHLDSLASLTDFLFKFQTTIPSSASDVLLITLPLLEKTCQKFLESSGERYAEVFKRLKDIEEQNSLFLKKYTPVEVKKLSNKERLQLMDPPENYRSLPVLPNMDDFNIVKAFIRPNIVNGCYTDSEHYLDVQYRLLREDYVKPLRDGITEYLRLKKSGKPVKQCKDCRVYENVQIVDQQFVNGGLVHMAYFNDSSFSRLRWEYSKRFLTGSLLCFSADGFQSMHFASVARRLPQQLKRGLLLLRFESDEVLSDEVLNLGSDSKFVVMETTAYFEAYRHNLSALLQLNENNLPMKRYIVEVKKEVNVPQYLTRSSTFDMRPLLMPMNGDFIQHITSENNDILTTYEFPPEINFKARSINVLDDRDWVSHTELKLDPTQFAALKAAVTKEFAVIQGPPGTGKTYIGLRIAQLLLHNKQKWETEENHTPILVVCYTNHALDQFLEGLCLFTQKVVRVGGRSNNEALAKFQLNNLKRILEDKRQVPNYIFSNLKQKQSELYAIKRDIDRIKSSVEDSFKNILGESQLKNCMLELHYRSLKQCDLKDNGNLILDWLEITVRSVKTLDDNEELDDSDNEDIGDFDVKSIFKDQLIDIPVSEGNQLNLNFDKSLLRNGIRYEQVLAQHLSEIIEICNPFSEMQANNIMDVWSLDLIYRWKLYRFFVNCYIQRKQSEYLEAMKVYLRQREEFRSDKFELLCSKQYIQHLKTDLQGSLSKILNENSLKDIIPPWHLNSLFNTNINLKGSSLVCHWLELNIENPNDIRARFELIRNLKFISNHLKNFHESTGSKENVDIDDEIDSEGEADIEYIEAERDIDSEEFLDVSFDIPSLKRKQKLIPTVDDGWKVQGGERKRKHYIKNNLRNNDVMSEEEAKIVTDVWRLPLKRRWCLYKYWLTCYINEKNRETFELQNQLRSIHEEICELRTEEDMYICREADVVGMTTTGAAKYRQIVQNLNPKIVIVEEAAEILESHLVTSLAPGTEHVILIGDHQQLRPSPTVHLLSVQYELNVSLFERMVQNGMDCYQLGIQHRMRPEIATLLVPHIYEKLENHESVTKYENIKGVMKNVFFITHNYSEQNEKDTKSHVNEHEAKFLLGLCKYFVQQGYDPSQITVLTTYSGQLFAMKRLTKKIISGVKITVVDNYQGEENDIILISFVRSNEEGEIGFLKVSNRVCVALSRAKKGLFCIGNFQLLAERSNLWKNIVSRLQSNQAIGASLQLVCQNHPNISNDVAHEKDFDSVPEGGCTRNCEARLSCGHTCPLMCHTYDKNHEFTKCLKPCNKKCSYGHPCNRKCSDECGLCRTLIMKTVESCRHQVKVKCYQSEEEIVCDKPCEKILSCGHMCLKKCGESCSVKCERICTVRSVICGHDIKVECFQSKNIDLLADKCTEPCRMQLACEHMCKGNCRRCHQGRLHVACLQPCKRILVCGHECKSPCSKSCPPCKKQCENRCVHSKCPKECGEPCKECTEPCEWQCIHKQCNRLCGQLCNRSPCDKPCPKILNCKHACIGLCGEPCPRQCRICNQDEVTEIFFGSEDEPDAKFICLEDCNHIFEINGISQWMTSQNSESREIQMKWCPKCKTVIRKNLRFGNVIKSCLQDIEKVKILTYGDKKRNILRAIELAKRLELSSVRYGKSLLDICAPLLKVLNSGKSRSVQELTVMENIISVGEIFVKALQGKDIVMLTRFDSDKLIKNTVSEFKQYLEKASLWLISFFRDEYLTASEQQLQELLWEVRRMESATKFLQYISERTNINYDSHFRSIIDCLMTYSPFCESNLAVFSKEFQVFTEKNGGAVINVTEDEKKSILKAMALSKGHWYQCPRGHVYCITECGGAMQQSTCNECGEQIGGMNHALLRSNQVATDMDGSRHGAWSDAMNMENYRF